MNEWIETWNRAAALWWDWTVTSTWQGLLLLAIFVGGLIVFRSLRPGMRYALLLLVLLKFALPPVLGIPYGFSDLLSRSATSDGPVAHRYESSIEFSQAAGASATVGAPVDSLAEATAPAISWTAWLFLLEALGALAMLYLLGKQTYRARVILGDSREDSLIHVRLEALGRSQGMGRTPRLAVSERIDSPMTGGVLRPFIALPPWVCAIPAEEQDILLAHELAHVRRRDALVTALQALVQAVLWWNPVVWWLNRAIREERELCCDDSVISSGIATGTTYSKLLVEVAERVSCRQSQWVMAGMADGFRKIDRRVRRAMDESVSRRIPSVVPAALLVMLTGAWILPGSTNGQESSAGAPAPEMPEGATLLPPFDLQGAGTVTYEVSTDSTTTEPGGISIVAAPDDIKVPALLISSDGVRNEVKADGSKRTVFEGNVKFEYDSLKFEAERLIHDGKLEFFDVVLHTRDFGEIRSTRIKADLAAKRLDILEPDMDESKLKAAFGPDATSKTDNGWLTLPFAVTRQVQITAWIAKMDVDAPFEILPGHPTPNDSIELWDEGSMLLSGAGKWESLCAQLVQLSKDGRAEIVAAPTLITLEEQSASIAIGTDVPLDEDWGISKEDLGTKLSVLPTVGDGPNGDISLSLNVTCEHHALSHVAGSAPTIDSAVVVSSDLSLPADGRRYLTLMGDNDGKRVFLIFMRAQVVKPA